MSIANPRGWNVIWEIARRDARYAIRSLARTPVFTATAVLVVAVGVGVNTAVFSVVNAVLLKPLTYPDSKSIVRVVTNSEMGSFPLASIPEYNVLREQSRIFKQVAGYDWGGAGVNLTGGDHPEQVLGLHVTSSYFGLFGAPVVAGRTFTTAEDTPNGGRVAVLSYGLWKRRFGGNPNIVGSTIQIDGQPWLVVGVIGRNFVTESPADLWIPFQFDLSSHDLAHNFYVAARLKPSVTLAQANAQLSLAGQQLRRTYGDNAMPPRAILGAETLEESLTGSSRLPLLILLGAVGFVLLIACANMANLLLARASVRKREFATRAALGAGPGLIVLQLLVESVLLSLVGGLIGMGLGFASVRLLLSINPGDIPRIGDSGSAVQLDFRVLLFALSISLLTGVVFGLVPAITACRPDLAAALNENSSRSGSGQRQGRVRAFLVVGEIAFALVLLTGAALLIRTFLNLREVRPGFTTHNVLTAAMSMSGDRFQKTAPVAEMARVGADRLRSVPGVLDATISNCLPLEGCFGIGFDILGRPKGDNPFTGSAGFFSVGPSYFSTLEVPLLRGRAFTEGDNSGAPGVIIINQTMARKYWPNGNPLNDRIQIGAGGPIPEPARQVVGIVGDTRDAGLSRDPYPTMYTPLAQVPDAETAMNSKVVPLWWIVRSQSDPRTLREPIEAALHEASGGLPVAHVRTMDEVEAHTTASQRFSMLLLTIFGAAGLLMAAAGVYGLMSYSVQQRTQELGVRMALGAQASHLRNMVIRQGMLLTVAGVVLGIGGAFWVTRFLASLLFAVDVWDPFAFIATPIVLFAVALIAVWIPAQRATRVDPIAALRLE